MTNTVEKFWSKVEILEENECWVWLAGVTPDGYGSLDCG